MKKISVYSYLLPFIFIFFFFGNPALSARSSGSGKTLVISNTGYTSPGSLPINDNDVFAAAGALESPMTFVLTNEGGLIDDLIRAGHGTKNLYQALEVLKPKSGGVISDEFMATLAKCPAGSEIFITQLNNYTGFNNPVCINTDGICNILGIFGKDYFENEGYTTYPKEGDRRQLFTYSKSPQYYIDAGASGPGTRYKAFAIAWSDSKVSSIFDNDEKNIFSVSPNPASDYIEINLNSVILSEAMNPIKIYNSFGECVMTEPIHQMTSSHRMNIEQLPVGLYFIQIGIYSQKFMVVR